jgi:cyclopropane fatty-acyl-phospholipid synthase-like methyltransferase
MQCKPPATLQNQPIASGYDSVAAYQEHLESRFVLYPEDRELAFATAVGSASVEFFEAQGLHHVAVLKHHGLTDGMSIYDLGCGCGRTAQALQKAEWKGKYVGADIIQDFVSELKSKCPNMEAHVHREPSIVAGDSSLDMLFHWSVFTHISAEECFLYIQDSFRALKNGGKLIFSFIELSDPDHSAIFYRRVEAIRGKRPEKLLDSFLHRDWIAIWADRIGFTPPVFTRGDDDTHHPSFWQTLAVMRKT